MRIVRKKGMIQEGIQSVREPNIRTYDETCGWIFDLSPVSLGLISNHLRVVEVEAASFMEEGANLILSSSQI